MCFSFPVNISLRGKKCLIFGLGEVGRRKLKALVEAQAEAVTILDLLPEKALNFSEDEFSASRTRLCFIRRSFQEVDLEGVFLVFACSSDREKNLALSTLCQTRNILCDNATDPDQGNFISPARVEETPLLVSVSTGGVSPLLAARLKRELAEWLKPRAMLATLMGKLRPFVLALDLPQARRREIFSSILDSPLPHWLSEGKFELCEQWLLDSLPFMTKKEMKEIFREL